MWRNPRRTWEEIRCWNRGKPRRSSPSARNRGGGNLGRGSCATQDRTARGKFCGARDRPRRRRERWRKAAWAVRNNTRRLEGSSARSTLRDCDDMGRLLEARSRAMERGYSFIKLLCFLQARGDPQISPPRKQFLTETRVQLKPPVTSTKQRMGVISNRNIFRTAQNELCGEVRSRVAGDSLIMNGAEALGRAPRPVCHTARISVVASAWKVLRPRAQQAAPLRELS